MQCNKAASCCAMDMEMNEKVIVHIDLEKVYDKVRFGYGLEHGC